MALQSFTCIIRRAVWGSTLSSWSEGTSSAVLWFLSSSRLPLHFARGRSWRASGPRSSDGVGQRSDQPDDERAHGARRERG